MKNRTLIALLLLSFIWAVTVSILYWRLKSNPRVVAVTMEAGKEALQNKQLGEIEKMTFLRQYLDRYFSYDSNSFWQSQTSLAFLMSPPLGESRIREVGRLREKIQQKNLSQLGQLRSLKQIPDGRFAAVVFLQITENSQKNDLYVTTLLKLQDTERTLENPWGLLVEEMTFVKTSPQAIPFAPVAYIQNQNPSLLTFPCALANIENPDEENLKLKITTLNISELQITARHELKASLSLVASCKDVEFKFELRPSEGERTLYLAFPTQAGAPRKTRFTGPRQKDIYEKTIENVLGIELDK